jgi:hypothetical protein
MPRRVIVEELLADADGAIPDDYKFFVFHGKCAFIQVDAGRFGRRTQVFFRPNWQHVPLSGGPPWADREPAKPSRLSEMIDVAERLGADTDFVRVDLYDVDGRVVFGELTSFPAGGDSPFEPESFNKSSVPRLSLHTGEPVPPLCSERVPVGANADSGTPTSPIEHHLRPAELRRARFSDGLTCHQCPERTNAEVAVIDRLHLTNPTGIESELGCHSSQHRALVPGVWILTDSVIPLYAVPKSYVPDRIDHVVLIFILLLIGYFKPFHSFHLGGILVVVGIVLWILGQWPPVGGQEDPGSSATSLKSRPMNFIAALSVWSIVWRNTAGSGFRSVDRGSNPVDTAAGRLGNLGLSFRRSAPLHFGNGRDRRRISDLRGTRMSRKLA